MPPLAKDKDLDEPKSVMDDLHEALVKRIISSSTFSKTERLSSFLDYICDQAMKGNADSLNEQRIGEAVFGRSHDYDSSIDGIVRTQGSRLRQRLDRYFAEEGANEPIRIVIPRGGYVPVFEPRSNAPATPGLVQEHAGPVRIADTNSEPAPARNKKHWLWIGAATAVLLAILLVSLTRHTAVTLKTASGRSPVHPLWSHMFVAGQRTLMVPGDSGLVIWEGLTHERIGLAEFIKGDYRTRRSANPSQEIANDLSQRRYTSIVDLEALRTLTRIAQTQKSELDMRYARDLDTNDLKEGNIVLIGAAEANPWVALYEPAMNFKFASDPVTHRGAIMNSSPHGGEPRVWNLSLDSAYAIVAYLPGLKGNGNALLIGGTSMTGTETALDFISDDTELLPFLKKIQRPDGRLPHFELVLGTTSVSANAVRSNILAWRVSD